MLLADWRLADGGPLAAPHYQAHAVNGRVYPSGAPLKVKKGDKVRLRLINASSSTIYDLSLAGHRLTVLALDGQDVTPRAFDMVRLAMGERVDVEFLADNPGAWLLQAHDSGLGESGLAVAVVYQGQENRAPGAAGFPPRPAPGHLLGFGRRPAHGPPRRPSPALAPPGSERGHASALLEHQRALIPQQRALGR